MQGAERTVYFRRKDKKSYAMRCGDSVQMLKIATIIAKKEEVDPDHLVFYHKGKAIGLNQKISQIQDHSIVHVIDMTQVRKQQLKIKIVSINSISSQYEVKSSGKIKELIQGKLANVAKLPYFYIGLVYLGKILHPGKSFKDELVQNGAQIVMVNIKDYIQKQGKVLSSGVHHELTTTANSNTDHNKTNPAKIQIKVDESNGIKEVALQNQEQINDKDLPQQIKIKFKVSEVQSVESDDQNHNRVAFTEQDSHSIVQEEGKDDKLQNQITKKGNSMQKAEEEQKELQAGDLIMTGSGYKSSTSNFLDNMVNQYKFMFD